MAEKNRFLLTPDVGEIDEIYNKGASSLLGLPEFPGTKTEVTTSAPASSTDSSVPATARRAAPTRDDVIRRATELGVDPKLALTLFGVESSSNWNTKDSPKGAVGGMQVMPGTYKQMMGTYAGQRNPWNNMEAGLRYIAYGQKVLGTNDPALLAAGYHAGYGRKELKQGVIPNTHDGLMSTRDYAAKVAGKVGLGAGKDLQAMLDQKEPGRYRVLEPEEAERLTLQTSLDEQEPGRYKVLSPWEVDSLPDDAFAGMPYDNSAAWEAAGRQKDVGFFERLPQVARNGWENMNRSLDVSRAVLSDDFSPQTVDTLAQHIQAQIDQAKKDQQNQHASERELKKAIEEFGKTEGWGDTTRGLFSLLGTAITNPKGVALGTIEQLANMLPSVGGAMAGAGAGATVGAAAGSVIPGAGTAAGAATGALWGSRAGLAAGTAALEFGNEITEAITSRLEAQDKAPTKENIAALLADPAMQSEFKAQAAKKGLTLAAVDAISMGLAGKVGARGVEAAKAGRRGAAAGYGAGAVGVELVGEPAGEAASQLVARGEIDKADVAAEGIFGAGAALGGAAVGTAGQAVRDRVAGRRALGEAPTAPEAAPGEPPAGGGTTTSVGPDGVTRVDMAHEEPAPQPSGPIGRAMEKATGAAPAQEAAQAAPAEPADLPRVRITAQNGDTITGFAEQIGPDGSGRVIGDDGQVYQFTADDGVTIEPIDQQQAAAPAPAEQTAAVPAEEAPSEAPAAEQPAVAAGDEAIWQNADHDVPVEVVGIEPEPGSDGRTYARVKRDGQESFVPADELVKAPAKKAKKVKKAAAKQEPAQPAVQPEQPEQRPLTEWSEAELRDRLKYVAQQFKNSADRTVQRKLAQERRTLEAEINRRQEQPAQEQPAQPAAPALDQDFPTQMKAQQAINRAGLSDTHHAVLDGAMWRIAPKEAKDVRGSDRAGSDRTADGNGVTDGRGTGADRPVSGSGLADAAAPGVQAGQAGPVNAGSADSKPALKDPAAGKWFGSREKADAFVAKKKLGDTHEVVQTGKVRFEVKPKVEQPAAPQSEQQGRGRPGYDTPVKVDARALKGILEESRGEPLAEKPEKVDALRKGAKSTGNIEVAFRDRDGKLDVNDGRHRIALAAERGEQVEVFVDKADAHNLADLVKPKAAEQATAEAPKAESAPLEESAERIPRPSSYPTASAWWNDLTPTGRRTVQKAAGVRENPQHTWGNMTDDMQGDLLRAGTQLAKDAAQPAQAEAAPSATTDRSAIFANNKIFTADKVEQARARLRSKLGQINSGIDPEVLIDGMTIAGAYIEGGVRKFSDFAAAMVEDFGDKVKPYLLSFYEGARAYPGLDTEGMTPVDQAKAEHAALLTPEVKAEVAEAVGEVKVKPTKRTRKNGSAGDKTLTQDWGVDNIDGWTELPGGKNQPTDYGLRDGVKDAFLKEARDYLRAVAKILTEQGYAAPEDKKGRPRQPVSVNEAGPAVSGDVNLTMRHSETGVNLYVNVSGTALRGAVPTTASGISVMYRVSRTEGDTFATSGNGNRWAPTDLSAADLAIMVDKEAQGIAPAAKQPKEIEENDRQATAGSADQGTTDQSAEGVSADAGQRDAEAVPEQPAGRDAGSDRGSAPRVDRRAGERGEPAVPGRSTQAVAGTEQPAESGRGRGDSASDRDDRGPVSRVGSNYRIQPGELTRSGSWKSTAEQNVRIVELVKQLEKDGRRPTPEEAALLTKFTGWGASEIANGIFPDRYGRYKDASWEKLGERLKTALTPEEYAQARRTTQYAHYTSEGVIRSIYGALQRMGFGGGKVLEPGMGIGLFNGLMPAGMAANSQYTGVEYDGLTGSIAKLLYPESNIIVGDFTKTAMPREFFDAAIGNPPFSSTVISNDPEYKKHGFMLHDYFFAKTIDRVKPGGMLVFVTSKGTMDKANDRARKYLAQRANLVGAIRLPQTAFKDNAGTEVVTDVIFLQKRGPGIEDNGVKWLGTAEVQTPQGPTSINEYFAAHPEMVLGAHALTGSMYRANEYTVVPEPGVDMDQAFAKAVQNLPEAIYQPGAQNPAASTAAALDRDFNPNHKKEGGLYVSDDGKLMQVESGTGVEITHRRGSSGKEIALKPADKAFLKSWVGLRDALKQAQLDQLTDGDWQASLKALGDAYDAFVAKHGNLLAYSTIERESPDGTTTVSKRFKNEPLLRLDVDGALAYSLEHIKESGEIVKAPVLTERVLQKRRDPEIKTTQDALFVSLNNKGSLDIEDVARLAGMSTQEVIDALGTAIYEVPGQGWQTADAYLSGNVVRKLKEAEAAARSDPRYKRNVEALLAVQPKPLGPTEITVKLGQNWIPASDIEAFASEALSENIDVTYSARTGAWEAEQRGSNYSEFNTPRMNAGQILDAVLNNRQIKVTFRDQDGKTHVDAEATEAANEVARKMRDAFSRWIWTDTKRSERLVNFYNENFNNIAPRQFDGSHLTLPGVSLRFNLYPHQKRAIWRMIQEGDTYLAHAVGAGKTFTMIAAGMEERRLGLSTKPMYVVPNHMLAQFAREFLELYPAANIMVADEENFHTHNRRRFVAQAALNNPDAIIITHSAFGRIGMSDEYAAQFIADQIDEWKQALDETDKGDRITRKQIERRIEQLERRLEARQGKEKKDQVLSFEELGVDRLFVDEAHEFRKLDFATNQGNIKGIDPSGSQRAMDMFMKVQYLRGKKPGRAIVMASGTPITNTMGELFTVQRFFQPEQMAEDGLDNFDAWANQYGDVVAGFEQNAAGGYEVVSRFAKFQNVPELMRRVRSFMDILTSSNLGELVQRPAVIGGGREVVVTPEPDGYRAYQKQLEGRINAIRARKGPPQKGDDIILNVIADGRFSSIDMRFVDPSAPSDPKSKLNQILDDLIAAYKETAGHEYSTNGKVDPIKGSSLILFTDIGLGEQSAKSRGFDMKAWIEQRLTEAGIPREHIAFMRDHKAHAKKERLFADMREGKKRILIGGKDMETGVNVQKRLTHLFHLDAPWFPASVEQREGRIIRQGNQNKEVVVRAYATKGSYDSTMWGMNGRKARFIEQAMNGDDSVRSLEDVSEASAFEMAAALASGDERYLRLAGLKADVDRLERLRFAHHDDQNKLRRDKHWAESAIERDTKLIDELKAAIAKRTPIRAGEFAGKVGKTSYDNREEFSNAIFNKFKDLAGKETDAEQQIGEIGGFPITFYGTRLKGSGEYIASVEVGVPGDPAALLNFPLDPNLAVAGIATRAANQVNALDRLLMEAEDAVSKNKRRVEQIGQRLGAPFPEEAELLDKMAELQALEAELTAEKAAEDAPAPSADAALATLEVEGEISNQDTPVAGQVGLAGDVPQSTRSEDLARRGDDAKYSVRDDGRMVAEFGPVYDEFKNDPDGAIKALMKDQEGEAVAAVTREGIGEISLIYGDKDKGLAHILERHGQEMLDRLPDLLRNGVLYSKTNQRDRVYIGTPNEEAVVRLDWDGDAKTWVVSAYTREKPRMKAIGAAIWKQEDKSGSGASSTSGLESVAEVDRHPQPDRSQGKVSRPLGNVNAIGVTNLRNILENGKHGGVVSSLLAAGRVVLHDTASSLPVRNTPTGVQAVTTPDGKIHLVAENLTADTALPVLLHEAFHGGAESLVGAKAWKNLLNRLGALHRQAKQSGGRAREFYDAARQRVAAAQRQGAASADITAEEFGAYTIEEYAQAPAAFRKWVDDLIGAIKAWLLRRFGIQAGAVTPAQLRALAVAALRDGARQADGARFSVAPPTESAAFKRWFGDSKVVDAEGKPLVVYHGTDAEFTAFSKDKVGSNTGFDNSRLGFFFIADKGLASQFAKDTSGGSRVMAAYLSIQKPLNLTKQALFSDKKQAPTVYEIFTGERLSEDEALAAINDEIGLSEFSDISEAMASDHAKEILDRDGYDGIISEFGAGHREYIAFRPEQIKSATDNRGTFDASNPDIRYSLTPEQRERALDEAAEALDAKPAVPRDDYVGRVVQDVSLGARLLVHPRTIAAIHPEFTPVYNTAVSQMETRDRHIAEFGRDVAAYTALPQESKAKVNKILELGRLTSRTYTAEQLESGIANTGTKTSVVMDDQGRPHTVKEPFKALLSEQGEVITLNEQERQAYLELRKMFDAALDKFRDQALEEFGFGHLAGKPNAAKEISSMMAAAKDAAETERLQNIARFIGEIEQAKRTGYVPLARYGDYVVTVKEKVADLKFVEDDADHLIVHGMPKAFDTEMVALGAAKKEGGWRILKSQKRAVDRLTEKTVYSTKIETGMGDMLKSRKAGKVDEIPSVKEAIEAARKEWVGDNPNRRVVAFRANQKEPDGAVRLTDVDALAEIANIDNATWDAVRDKLAAAIQGRSFRRHFFHSDNVPGYTGDFERAIADYVIGMSGYLSRRSHQKQWDRSIDNIKDKGKLHQYATRYRDYVNSPQEEFALVRQIGFLSYIAGVLATAYANLTQVPMMTVPTLSQLAPTPLVIKELSRAYKDAMLMMTRRAGLDMFDPRKAPKDVRRPLMEAWDEGAFVPLETFDLMMMARQRNVGRRKFVKGFNDFTKIVSVAFTFAERLNRLVTFIAAARLAEKRAVRENAKRVLAGDALARSTLMGSNWTPKNFAEWAVDESQYRMGKANRPTTMRGVGAAIMQFKSFMLQTFEAWYRMAALHGRPGKYAMAASLLTLYALSGVWGMPGADDLRRLIEAAYKAMTDEDLDLKTELRAWVARVSGSNTLSLMVSKGLSYPLGVDLTRVGLGNVAPDSALNAAGIPFDLLIGRPTRAFEKGAAGDYFGAAGELTPNFIKHWLVAAGWAVDGVRDKYGQRLVTGDDLSKTDLVLKAMGFQPSIITDIRDYEYAQRRQETAADEIKRRFSAQIARTMVQMEKAEEKGDINRLEELDAELSEIFAEIDEHNDKAKPEAQVRIDRRALRNRIMREREGVKSTWGRERKAARGAAEELRGLFGLTDGEMGEDERYE